MKIKLCDNGEVVNVNSIQEFVSWLNSHSHTPAINDAVYMREYARRAVIAKNEDIRATSVQDFVEDLIKHKHIEVLEMNGS